MRIYQQNSTCVRTTVKGEAMTFPYPVSAYVFCLYIHVFLELSCSNSEASRTFKKSASDLSFWEGDNHQKWRTQYTFARHLSILNLMNPCYNRRFKFSPSPGYVKSPGLYFMHLRFAQRCLAHAALMPTLQSGGRCGGWCNGERWRVWENCWSCRSFASYQYIRFVGPPKMNLFQLGEVQNCDSSRLWWDDYWNTEFYSRYVSYYHIYPLSKYNWDKLAQQ